MPSLLKIIRYFVFVVFVICNAIITSIAVWNLAIVETITSQLTARHIDSFLIFVGSSGLLLMFTILFFELYGKNVFLGKVWFELAWTGMFFIMELVGAAVITAQTTLQTCGTSTTVSSQESPCASTEILQAFTWVLAILLLGYLTLLSILTIVKQKDDPTIWQCSVRKFPLMTDQSLKSAPASPSVPRFLGQAPIIVAPTPRRIPAREAVLSYRSGLSLEYDIEHFHVPESALHAPVLGEQTIAPLSMTVSPPPQTARPVEQVQRTTQPSFSSPFYHTAVQSALDDRPNQPDAPLPAHVSQIRRLPPSPPPLGDWPRLDATARPRVKRKPLPQPLQLEPQNSVSDSHSLPQLHPQPQRQHSRPLPQPQPHQTSSSSYTFDAPALTAALQPIASQSWRSKPSGPRRNTSVDDGRPTDLDLSNISTFRSPGFS